jgi:hypothetical protein
MFSYIMVTNNFFFLWDNDDICFIYKVQFDFNSDCSLKQQLIDKHIAILWHITRTMSRPVVARTPLYYMLLAEKLQLPILQSLILPYIWSTQWSTTLEVRTPFHHLFYIYSQTCIKRSLLRQRQSDLLRQVTSQMRFNSYEIFLWLDKKKVTF